jgi:hypothetical protein
VEAVIAAVEFSRNRHSANFSLVSTNDERAAITAENVDRDFINYVVANKSTYTNLHMFL